MRWMPGAVGNEQPSVPAALGSYVQPEVVPLEQPGQGIPRGDCPTGHPD